MFSYTSKLKLKCVWWIFFHNLNVDSSKSVPKVESFKDEREEKRAVNS